MRWRVVLWAFAVVLLIPAALLTIARLSGSDLSLAVKAVAFTPAGVLLYAGGLVVLLALAVRRGRRRWPMSVAALAAAGLGLHLAWVAPWYVGTSAASDAEPSLRVLTANVLGDAGDGPGLVEAAADADIDVLAVQELSTGTLAEMDRAGLAELFPYRAGEPDPGDKRGTMVFAREPISDVTRLPTVMGSWSVRIGDVTAFVVHPAYPLRIDSWRTEHAALLAAAEELEPDLVVGDLNATLDHAPMRRLLDAGYRDATELSGSGWQPTWPASGSGLQGLLPPVVQIDHVLVDDGWTAVRTWTVEIDGTDHRALVAELAAG
ncbi:endonuclease/exonuclease/phosphatase family protein [Nocardioides sp. W7]|uniref:endonuclease/exonuclease/phosphatase family protein n=1 Tax=Nocardioides sp. W7 TaxID=2931390 RepID=UPI001FD185EF|nr:endonuclease/exonuclease/phosphatase family protein [Nocardioides sp. W7]